MELIKVLLVGDHTIVRQGLCKLLESEPDITVVGEIGSGRESVLDVKGTLPDVVVMEVAMPGPGEFNTMRRLIVEFSAARLLVLSSDGGNGFEGQITGLGAARYLCKRATLEDLLQAIRAASFGTACFNVSVSKKLVDRGNVTVPSVRSERMENVLLTARESEVLQLIAAGMANKQIAAELCISIKTVEKHRQRVMNKLKIHNTAGLTRYAISNGVIENESFATA